MHEGEEEGKNETKGMGGRERKGGEVMGGEGSKGSLGLKAAPKTYIQIL